MAEEAVTESRALVRALDQAGDVGQHEFLGRVQAHNAELRVQRGEGIVRDLRPGGGAGGQEGGLAGIRQADEPGIRDQLQPQPDPALLPGVAGIGAAGGAVGARFVMGVAVAAIAAAAENGGLAGLDEVGEDRFLVVGQDDGADGHLQDHVVGGCAGAVRAGTVAALAGLEVLGIAVVDKGVQPLHRLGEDIAAAAAIAAVRAAKLDVLLATEGDDAVSAVTGLQIDLGLVEELHGNRGSKNRNGGREGPP
jgi:hypothetical protein